MWKIEKNPNPESGARLVGYLHDKEPEAMPDRLERPAVVICPGGGYEFCSSREADPPAFAFFSQGYHVFVLYYSVGEQAQDMCPLIDLSRSVMLIRENAAEWGVVPDKIAVCGFSAGGHLAASLGTLWNHAALKEKIDTRGGQNRPNALILGYPVITAGAFAHRGSIDRLTGGRRDAQSLEFWSLENRVSADTPPAFLWHTFSDGAVPVENSLLFASALRRAGVPFECHVYPEGEHGLSMCTHEVGRENVHCATWFGLCAQWLNTLFSFAF